MRRSESSGESAGAEYLAVVALTREHRHRVVLAVGLVSLLALTVGPVLGHHVASGLTAPLAGWDHVGQLCLVALHLLLEPVHTGFHVLLGAGLTYALSDRARAWWRMRRTLAPLDVGSVAPGGAIAVAAAAAGLDPQRLRVVDGLPNPAFTAGWWRPTVYVARGLPLQLTRQELAAVLAHEAAHVRRRDPLRLSLLRFLACTLFWVPALRRLAADVADDAEILADDAAAGAGPLVLASALVRVAALATARPAPLLVPDTVAFAPGDLLDRRVRRLLGEDTAPVSHVTRRSVLGALAALVVVWMSMVSVIHPLPGAVSAESVHCEHHGGSPVTHLFCRDGSHASRHEGICPHATGVRTAGKPTG